MIRVCSFGEVLWDLFGSERAIGGAPFNFSAHLSRLGAEVTFVSAVGSDPLGSETLDCIRAMGMSADSVAVLPDRPTGYCAVSLVNGAPDYDLAEGVAYDSIPLPGKNVLENRYDALYFGTLASRNPESARTRDTLLRSCAAREIFFDINIRGKYWSSESLAEVLPYVTILKFSREEMGVFGKGNEKKICEKLFRTYPNLRLIVLTRDKDGAWIFDGKTVLKSEKPRSKVVSTVGAGDSFSACFLYNYLAGQSLSVCLERAIRLSDYVVTQLGAIPDYPDDLLSRIR